MPARRPQTQRILFALTVACSLGAPTFAQTTNSSTPGAHDIAQTSKLDTFITLTDGKRSIKRKRRELAIGMDSSQSEGAARFKVNRDLLQKTLRGLAGHFGEPPRDAKLVASGASVKVAPAVAGRILDPATSAVKIATLVEQQPARTLFQLVMKKVPARIQASAYQGMNGRLCQFATSFNEGNAKRAHNLRLAARSIDGELVKPGQVFSLNRAIGARNHENGFLTAKVFENGRKVDGIGGGVSQVAGTLFNAVLLAGLPIVQYQGHSRPVAYLPVGRDATVAWNLYDLKFKNNTRAPVYIVCRPVGSRLVADLYGAKLPGRKVAVSVQAKRLAPNRIKTTLYRTIKDYGKVIKREVVGHWDYHWQNAKPASVAAR
jgi:vancomycin resistance protein YoaR